MYGDKLVNAEAVLVSTTNVDCSVANGVISEKKLGFSIHDKRGL